MRNYSKKRVDPNIRILMSGVFAGLGPLVLGLPKALKSNQLLEARAQEEEFIAFNLKQAKQRRLQ